MRVESSREPRGVEAADPGWFPKTEAGDEEEVDLSLKEKAMVMEAEEMLEAGLVGWVVGYIETGLVAIAYLVGRLVDVVANVETRRDGGPLLYFFLTFVLCLWV